MIDVCLALGLVTEMLARVLAPNSLTLVEASWDYPRFGNWNRLHKLVVTVVLFLRSHRRDLIRFFTVVTQSRNDIFRNWTLAHHLGGCL